MRFDELVARFPPGESFVPRWRSSPSARSSSPPSLIANLTGQPAMSVPLFESPGLPIGVQFMARNNEEGLLFRVAAQLEKAQPWFAKRPT